MAIAAAFSLQEWALPAIELSGLAAGAELSAGEVVLNAGISGGVSGYISTGRLNGAILGSLESVAFAGVHFAKLDMGFPAGPAGYSAGQMAESAGMHGMVGGLFSVAGGGKFGSGFLAAGVSDLGGGLDAPGQTAGAIAENTALHAVTGGLGSILGGGKFENGAATGAFGYLFNYCGHSGACRPGESKQEMSACALDDTACIHRVLDDMEGSGERLPFTDPRSIFSFFGWTFGIGAGGGAATVGVEAAGANKAAQFGAQLWRSIFSPTMDALELKEPPPELPETHMTLPTPPAPQSGLAPPPPERILPPPEPNY